MPCGGAATPARRSTAWSAELYRRAAISFPDEDVLVAGRIAHPGAYSLFSVLVDVCPRPKYTPNGEERAWGRRLARRFGCDARYDERSFRLTAHGVPELVLDARVVKAGGKVAAELIGEVDPANGEARHRVRLGDGRGPRRRPLHSPFLTAHLGVLASARLLYDVRDARVELRVELGAE